MMLDCAATYSLLRKQGFRFFAGVPDSLLKDFCAYVSEHASSDDHVIAANEGSATALALGNYLGTGEPAVVYMQNSGTGNAVNPLLSLADPEVYSIPMLLIIGWRGEPGVKDEPQHVKQGRTMTELLDAMEVPWFLLPREMAGAGEVISDAVQEMRERMGPVAILVRKKTFEPYKMAPRVETKFPMNREEAIKCIVRQLGPDDLIVSTTGKASRELYEYRLAQQSECSDFLTVGGMGHTASIAMGLARARPEQLVVCLDGDGSVIMHMGALGVIGSAASPNLLHIVINNGAHDSVGGQPTVGYDIDIPAIASACGYSKAVSVSAPNELEAAIVRLRGEPGPVLLEVKVNKGARADLGRPKSTPIENRDALMKRIGL
jgi:phosphonopyruvate decarboxylase